MLPAGLVTRSVFCLLGHSSLIGFSRSVCLNQIQVGEVEYDYDRAKYDVEEFPENAAGWVGDKVGEVERFDDRVDDSYYEGRQEGREGW
jgi:hypothetical protein